MVKKPLALYSGKTKELQSGDYMVPATYDAIITGTGVDNGAAIQTALSNYSRILFIGASVTNTTLTVASNQVIDFAEGASIKVGSSPDSSINSSGHIFMIYQVDNVKINSPKILNPATTLTLDSTVIGYVRIENSTRVRITDPYFTYSGTVNYFQGIMCRGTTDDVTVVRGEMNGASITYSDGGAKNVNILGTYVHDVRGNGFNGIGNSGTNHNCLLAGVRLKNIGRMGIEDQQNIYGTKIINPTIENTGTIPALGEGMGISAVGQEFVIDGGTITDWKYLAVETFGNSGGKLSNMTLTQTTRSESSGSGVIVDLSNGNALNRNHGILITNLTIVNAVKGVVVFGATNPAVVISNIICKDAILSALDINTGAGTGGEISISNFTIENREVPLTGGDAYKREVYLYNTSGSTSAPKTLLNNVKIRYYSTSTGGGKYLEGFSVNANNVTVQNCDVQGNSVLGNASVGITGYVNSSQTGLRYLFNNHSGCSASITGSAYALNNSFSGGTGETGGTSPWTEVSKAADESRSTANTGATMTSDGTLAFSMAANTNYKIKIEVMFDAPTTPGFKWSITGPASPTEVRITKIQRIPGATSPTSPAPDTAYGVSTTINGNASPTGELYLNISVKNGANAGTFAFQWAQNSANATGTIVKGGSDLKYKTW